MANDFMVKVGVKEFIHNIFHSTINKYNLMLNGTKVKIQIVVKQKKMLR